MHLLLDANLSWRIINQLETYFRKIEHVDNIPFLSQPAKDIEIWKYAKANNAITNDDDFSLLSIAHGFPPKVILLKTGNQSNKYISEIIIKHQKDIQELNEANEYGLLEIL